MSEELTFLTDVATHRVAFHAETTIPRSKVYGWLADFGALGQYLPDVESVELHGSGIGAIREIRLPHAGTVYERLELLIPETTVVLSMCDGGPMPFDWYVAVISLSDGPDGGCVIDWRSNWVPRGVSPDDVRGVLVDFYQTMVDGIVALER
ncbi:SRPBCC family protein [Rhodococcus koreensis]|uniref:SRPBCC family protein n=1 Tax=Rhodococcus koreensis TaxID=99653 RepID=UPI00366FA6B0